MLHVSHRLKKILLAVIVLCGSRCCSDINTNADRNKSFWTSVMILVQTVIVVEAAASVVVLVEAGK